MYVEDEVDPMEDVFPESPAPADEEHPPGSSYEEEGEEANDRSAGGEHIATLDADDDLGDGETTLDVPTGQYLVISPPAAISAALVKRSLMLRMGMGWLKGTITREAQAHTRHIYDFKVFLERNGSTHRIKLPLAKYSVDGASRLGSWANLGHYAQALAPGEEESNNSSSGVKSGDSSEADSEDDSSEGVGDEEEKEEEEKEEEKEDETEEDEDEEDDRGAGGSNDKGKQRRGAAGTKRQRSLFPGAVGSTTTTRRGRACMRNVRLTDR